MSDRLREAAQAAVEVLEDLRGADTGYDIGDTVRCLRDALAEPPQDWEAVAADQAMTIAMLRTEIAALAEQEVEPVAWLTGPHGEIERNRLHKIEMPQSVEVRVPLYAHPPRREWRGLTDEEIIKLVPNSLAWNYGVGLEEAGDFARAIEAALKEKNHG